MRVAEAARPVFDCIDELVLSLLEALFGRLPELLPHLVEPLLNAGFREVDLVVSKSGQNRRRLVDDRTGHDVDQFVDLPLHADQLFLGQPLRNCGIHGCDEHLDLAAQGTGSRRDEPIHGCTSLLGLSVVEIELHRDLTSHPASPEILQEPRTTDSEDQQDEKRRDDEADVEAGRS